MKSNRTQSLGRRLSYWLAVLNFAGLVFSGAVVYAVTFYAFQFKQSDDLRKTQNLILNLAEEALRVGDEAMLIHKLDDFLGEESGFLLSVKRSDGSLFYGSRRAAEGGEKVTKFRLATHSSGSVPLEAELSLDVQGDAIVLHRVGVALIFTASAGALLTSIGCSLFIWQGLKPLRELSERVHDLGANTLDQRIEVIGQPDELVPLILQFNALLARLERSHNQLEGFNADVAHELLTPLATLTSSTELALRQNLNLSDTREVLGSNLEELERVAHIVHDMLFLAQADRGVVARREFTASLASVAKQVVNYYEAELTEANLSLEVIGDAVGAFDVSLIQRALSNLVSNALRYANPGSVVFVKICESSNRTATIFVENRGLTISSTDVSRIFDRFFRGESVDSCHRNLGLGLSIVAAIAHMHGGDTTVMSEGGVTSVGMTIQLS